MHLISFRPSSFGLTLDHTHQCESCTHTLYRTPSWAGLLEFGQMKERQSSRQIHRLHQLGIGFRHPDMMYLFAGRKQPVSLAAIIHRPLEFEKRLLICEPDSRNLHAIYLHGGTLNLRQPQLWYCGRYYQAKQMHRLLSNIELRGKV
jgi:hypothetical protein